MKLNRYFIAFLFFFTLINKACIAKQPNTLVSDEKVLELNRSEMKSGDNLLTQALKELVQDADKALKRKPHSVIEKRKMPPSGDKHDYTDMSIYMWPDPSKPDGLPYIRKDGKQNPEVRKYTDKKYLMNMARDVHVLGLAWFYTGREEYAAYATKLLRVWFLDENTRMNPNLNYAAFVPGRRGGSGAGTIRTRVFVDMLDGVQLLTSSRSWTQNDHTNLQNWFKEYLNWMENSSVGKNGGRRQNNIGTAYDVQRVAYALFIGDEAHAKDILENSVPQRIEKQLQADGSQPEELSRANAWGYCAANLNYFFTLAQLGDNLGVDLWNYKTSSGKGIEKAYDWMAAYAKGERKWDYKKTRNIDFSTLQPIERIASSKFKEKRVSARRTMSAKTSEKNADSSTKQTAKQKLSAIQILTTPNN